MSPSPSRVLFLILALALALSACAREQNAAPSAATNGTDGPAALALDGSASPPVDRSRLDALVSCRVL
ncbi:hypothetical protein QFW77_11345 [Luteimonas sp. RD2P54]|uniref:Uncharacterized protein n=1 Tax=Luteimonas endophytica TaxID=3042023 RepID=A0ABT6J9T3_9GAMM|nr:hypothetical protein [Luteimonas endophytica]MDH5823581.1 hypothetical protein [Luteimonas endophytica]